jgi:hypothetical protein
MPMQYHLPFEKKRINKLIDHAIIEADHEDGFNPKPY